MRLMRLRLAVVPGKNYKYTSSFRGDENIIRVYYYNIGYTSTNTCLCVYIILSSPHPRRRPSVFMPAKPRSSGTGDAEPPMLQSRRRSVELIIESNNSIHLLSYINNRELKKCYFMKNILNEYQLFIISVNCSTDKQY